MSFSRMHIGLLGIVSLFTGIISPVVQNNNASFPFPLTDLQIPAYIILILLSIICILLTVRSWSWVRFFGLLVLILLGYAFIIAWNGEVKSLTGVLVPSISWGWIFLIIGSGFLIGAMFANEDELTVNHVSISDHMIGWFSAITILALTGLIVYISYIPRRENPSHTNILTSILGSGSTTSHSGVTISIPFLSIHNLVFDRKHDNLSFYTTSGTQMVSVPSGQVYDRLPYTTTTIGDIQYIIHSDGSIKTESGLYIGKAILPQEISDSVLMQSGNTLLSITNNGTKTYSGEYTDIREISSINGGEHTVWKAKYGTGYAIYKDGIVQLIEANDIYHITLSLDGKSIMAMIKEKDGSQYIIKNGIKIEKISTGYIEGSLRMNGNDVIYAVEHDGAIQLIHNSKLLDRKFDEIREIFLERGNNTFIYFGRPLGEKTYCLYTSYRGNLCGLSGYMNPRFSADGTSIIYAGLKDGAWGIYRNASPIIRNTGYPNRDNISEDYVFFDITNPSYYLFIRHMNNGYQLYTKGSWIDGTWKDIGLDATFGYDNKIIMSVQDDKGWRVIEF